MIKLLTFREIPIKPNNWKDMVDAELNGKPIPIPNYETIKIDDMLSYQQWTTQWAKEALRVLIPGASMFVMGGCYDGKTEILTKDGWKFFKDISKKDKILTLNPITEVMEYQKPSEIVEYDYNGKMYQLETEQLDLLVTPDHWLFVRNNKNKKWKFVKAKDAKDKYYFFKKNGIWKRKKENWFILPSTKISNGHCIKDVPQKKIKMNIWIKFFGLWLAEGSTSSVKVNTGQGYSIKISHGNTLNLKEIQRILSPYFKSYIYCENQLRINNKQLYDYLKQFGKAKDKFIPTKIKNLPLKQLKVLFDWYIRGDGNKWKHKTVCWTTSERLRDDLQEIALKIGISANYRTEIKRGQRNYMKSENRWIECKNNCYILSFIKYRNHTTKYNRNKRTTEKWINYEGKVYCVEVPKYHTLYVRRNGKPVWCGNTRTYHRMGCGIEDAGFQIKDCLIWSYASGFPKSQDLGMLFDKQECMKQLTDKLGKTPTKEEFDEKWKTFRKIIETGEAGLAKGYSRTTGAHKVGFKLDYNIIEPSSDLAKQWSGWKVGGIKPSFEPIIWSIKQPEGAIIDNVLKYGVGAINVDECRIPYKGKLVTTERQDKKTLYEGGWDSSKSKLGSPPLEGRYPSNLIRTDKFNDDYDKFYYIPKASREEREIGLGKGKLLKRDKDKPYQHYADKKDEMHKGITNIHPTVKPIRLMQHLIKLVTKENQIVLDPFVGSGTTCIAAHQLNRKWIGIDNNKEYVDIARARIKFFTDQIKLDRFTQEVK